MKPISSLIVLFIAALAAPNLFAQEIEKTSVETNDDSAVYLEQIIVTCKAEAEGLPDAEEYEKQCIEMLKESFSQ